MQISFHQQKLKIKQKIHLPFERVFLSAQDKYP